MTLIKSLNFKSYLLGRLKRFVTTKNLLKIYVTYVLPLIDYCDILYHGANEGNLDKLQRVQNRCLKYCLKVRRLTPTDYVHQEAKIPKLDMRRQYHAQVYGFKMSKMHTKIDHRPLHTRLAQYPLLKYSFIHTTSYENSIEVYVAQTWNALLPSIRGTESLAEFKKLMKVSLADSIPKNIVYP